MARTVSLAFLLLMIWSLIWTAAADEPNQAGLVVQFEDGRVETRCVSFEGDQITGADLLALSGLDAIVDPSSGMGVTVCQIQGEGCPYPAEPCFCQCMGGGDCAYWNYFFRDVGEANWTYSALGAAIHKTKPGSVEGWVWGDGHSPPAQELTFELICAPPTPDPTATSEPAATSPATATAQATASKPATTAISTTVTASPSETPRPTDPPTGLPATIAPPSGPTRPAASSSPATLQGATPASGLSSYLPFGLMIAALAVVAGLVWFLRR
jgi:hypothetical protein